MKAKLTQMPLNYKPNDENSFKEWFNTIREKTKHSYLKLDNYAFYYQQEQ
jgi:hypothetical protein